MAHQFPEKFRGKRGWYLLIVAGGLIVLVGAVISLFVVNAGIANTSASPPIQPTQAKAFVSTTTPLVALSPRTTPPPKMTPVQVRAYTIEGPMADGKPTHPGACAVSTAQFPLGTIIFLYNPDGSFNRQCIAEDTGSDVSYGQIDLAMPGDKTGAINWGVRNLRARVIRWGWNGGGTPTTVPTP